MESCGGSEVRGCSPGTPLFWEGCPGCSQVCPGILATAYWLSGEVGGRGEGLACLLFPACLMAGISPRVPSRPWPL